MDVRGVIIPLGTSLTVNPDNTSADNWQPNPQMEHAAMDWRRLERRPAYWQQSIDQKERLGVYQHEGFIHILLLPLHMESPLPPAVTTRKLYPPIIDIREEKSYATDVRFTFIVLLLTSILKEIETPVPH